MRRRRYYIITIIGLIVLVWLIYTSFKGASATRKDAQLRRVTPTLPRASECQLNCNGIQDNSSQLFYVKPLVIWSNDYHIGPIRDLKNLLQPFGVKFIDNSLSANCNETRTCAHYLRILHKERGVDLDPAIIPRFQLTYSQDAEMLTVDAFVCFHPAAMCELFMGFNRSVVVIATTRYEMGRWTEDRWKQWNQNLETIYNDPKNIVAANNVYDANYIEYFTGIKPTILPSYCGYINAKYNPTRPEILLAPIHKAGFRDIFMSSYSEACDMRSQGCPRLVSLRELYPRYEHSDLAAHPAIVYVPYQVSIISVFEQYRMGIPLFFPSIDLLTKWQLTHQVMKERTWDGANDRRPHNSTLPPHSSQIGVPDPNCDTDPQAIGYWIRFSDFYILPHITLFDSAEDLIQKITTADFNAISERMHTASEEFKYNLLLKWKMILQDIAQSSKNKPC